MSLRKEFPFQGYYMVSPNPQKKTGLKARLSGPDYFHLSNIIHQLPCKAWRTAHGETRLWKRLNMASFLLRLSAVFLHNIFFLINLFTSICQILSTKTPRAPCRTSLLRVTWQNTSTWESSTCGGFPVFDPRNLGPWVPEIILVIHVVKTIFIVHLFFVLCFILSNNVKALVGKTADTVLVLTICFTATNWPFLLKKKSPAYKCPW